MSVDNLVNKALQRIGNVHPVVKQGAEEIIRQAYKQGIYVLFSDGYRSNAEQEKLYAQGRFGNKGPIVTNARGGQSLHNYGLALDMFITNKEGTTASWNVSDLRRVAQIAKGLGFEWGGDWKSFKDNPHLQMTGGLTIAQLQRGQKPNIRLKGASAGISTPIKPQTKPAKTSKLTVDGKWGKSSTRELQKVLGTPVDGIISKQPRNSVSQSLYGGTVQFGNGGSNVIVALQKRVKANADGKLGPATVRALQRYLGTPQDGVLSRPSTAVKEMQHRLNKGKF